MGTLYYRKYKHLWFKSLSCGGILQHQIRYKRKSLHYKEKEVISYNKKNLIDTKFFKDNPFKTISSKVISFFTIARVVQLCRDWSRDRLLQAFVANINHRKLYRTYALSLKESYDLQVKENRELKRQILVLKKKLKDK